MAAAGQLVRRSAGAFRLAGDQEILDEAITILTAVITHSQPGQDSYRIRANSLATAWQMRYELSGDHADIDQSIELLRQAAEDGAGGGVATALLHNLSAAYWRRFKADGDVGDLDLAEEADRRALAGGGGRRRARCRTPGDWALRRSMRNWSRPSSPTRRSTGNHPAGRLDPDGGPVAAGGAHPPPVPSSRSVTPATYCPAPISTGAESRSICSVFGLHRTLQASYPSRPGRSLDSCVNRRGKGRRHRSLRCRTRSPSRGRNRPACRPFSCLGHRDRHAPEDPRSQPGRSQHGGRRACGRTWPVDRHETPVGYEPHCEQRTYGSAGYRAADPGSHRLARQLHLDLS